MPLLPLGGVLPDVVANEELNARTVDETGTLAVTARSE
jgi:hypothetical protein